MAAPKNLLKKLAEQEAIAAKTAGLTDAAAPTDTPDATEPPAAADTDVQAPVVAPAPEPEPSAAQLKTAQGIAEAAGRDLRELRDRYDRDIKAIQDENASLRATIKEQMEAVDRLLQQPRVSEQEPPPENKKPVINIPEAVALTESDTDVLAAYDGLAPVFQKMFVSKEEIGAMLQSAFDAFEARLTGEIAPVREQVDTITRSATEQKANSFQSDVNSHLKAGFPAGANVPDCIAIHENPEFVKWVSTTTDLNGNSYVAAYNRAVTETFDAKLAARIQGEFLRLAGAGAAPKPKPETPAPEPASSQSGIPSAVEDMIAPPKSSGGEIPTVRTPKTTITIAEVKALAKLACDRPNIENQTKYANALRQYTTEQAAIAAVKS